ncbi:MAG TPA: H-NS histone family protein [Nitrococcus sp.]|nr:H-NS histone family protein [Nitrococcus sp.]
MDLSKYTPEELQWLKKDIDKELTSRRKMDAKKAQKELKSVAERYGFTLNELVSGQTAKPVRAKGDVRFRHPDDVTKIWSGRGRKPVWVKQWEAEGRSLDELRVEPD